MGQPPTPFLFIFVLVKHKFYPPPKKKPVGFSGTRFSIVKVEGEHAYHLTTSTAHAVALFSFYAATSRDKLKST